MPVTLTLLPSGFVCAWEGGRGERRDKESGGEGGSGKGEEEGERKE